MRAMIQMMVMLIPPRELDGARPCSVQLSGWQCIGYWVMRKAMSFHNRFWTLADLGDESNDANDGDAPFEDDHIQMEHHHHLHQGSHRPRELDGARPCSVQLSGWMRAWWRWWSWVWFISTFAVNKIYAHDAPFELTSNLGCNAHLSWVRCISSLLPFAGGLWWWCNWLVAAEWVTVASMSQSTFKHTSAAAIFFPSAWRFIWVLCQTLPRASQPVGWLRGSVKGLALLHEGSRKFYANPFPKLASLKTSDWSGLGRDGFWGTHHGISINIWCKLEKHQLVKDILAGCMNVDETRRRSCVDLWMGLEDMRGVSEKAAAEHCGWDLICGRGPRKGYNQKKIHGPHDMFPRLPLDLMWFDLANPMGHH